MKKIFLSLSIIVLTINAQTAHAQLFLEQGKIHETAGPGDTITGILTIHNTSDQPITTTAVWEDFVYEPPFEGSKKFLPQGTTDTSLASWVTFNPKEINLPPFGKQNVEFTIRISGDFNKGHYGVLFFEKAYSAKESEKAINIVTRVGCLFFIEPNNKVKRAAVSDFKIENNQFIAQFKNNGNVILIPDGIFYIIDNDGLVIQRGNARKVYLPPSATADYMIDLDPEIPAKKPLTLVLTIDLQDDNVLVKEIDFQKEDASNITILEVRD